MGAWKPMQCNNDVKLKYCMKKKHIVLVKSIVLGGSRDEWMQKTLEVGFASVLNFPAICFLQAGN